MKKKHLLTLSAVITGLGIGASHSFGAKVVAAQMVIYSVSILAMLGLGFWEDRRSNGYWIRATPACGLHFILLYLARGLFPFRSILVFALILLIEGTVLTTIMIRRDAEEPVTEQVRAKETIEPR